MSAAPADFRLNSVLPHLQAVRIRVSEAYKIACRHLQVLPIRMCDFETRQQLLSSPLIQSFADFTDAEGRQPTGGLLCYVLCAITIANTKFSELSLFSWYNFRIPLKTKTHLRSWVLIDCDLGNMIKSTVFCSTSLTLHIFPVAKNQFYKKRTKAALSVESTAAWAGEFERG